MPPETLDSLDKDSLKSLVLQLVAQNNELLQLPWIAVLDRTSRMRWCRSAACIRTPRPVAAFSSVAHRPWWLTFPTPCPRKCLILLMWSRGFFKTAAALQCPRWVVSQFETNSLITGKLTGNFVHSGPGLRFWRPAGERIQWLAAKFPMQPNREFLEA
jgi:hypothetical protein